MQKTETSWLFSKLLRNHNNLFNPAADPGTILFQVQYILIATQKHVTQNRFVQAHHGSDGLHAPRGNSKRAQNSIHQDNTDSKEFQLNFVKKEGAHKGKVLIASCTAQLGHFSHRSEVSKATKEPRTKNSCCVTILNIASLL